MVSPLVASGHSSYPSRETHSFDMHQNSTMPPSLAPTFWHPLVISHTPYTYSVRRASDHTDLTTRPFPWNCDGCDMLLVKPHPFVGDQKSVQLGQLSQHTLQLSTCDSLAALQYTPLLFLVMSSSMICLHENFARRSSTSRLVLCYLQMLSH